ncbi:MAG TPA: SusD/RagB family nutrient-binding outer membrane lipoprotein, partial [Saprospiraceae bacterium]|nr:SusD/RagB family nutrient-binding outer membrane lipoprotein [Saprospiraceae bacterium]
MKNIFYKISLAFISVIFIASCNQDDLIDLNNNPNAVTSMDPSFLLTTAILRIGGEYENTRAPMLYASTMIQQTASTAGYFSGDKYFYNAQYSGAYMEAHYPGLIRLLSNVIDQTKDDPSRANLNAMATITRAFDLHRMTDIYGDIPYKQAGYGLQSAENWFPAYDTQKDVYAAIIAEVKAARDKMSASGGNVGAQDVIFNGDIAKWKKFANALLMRAALRMQKVDEATGKSVFAEAFASGTFTSNAEHATIKYLNGPQGHNRNGLNDGYWGNNKYSRDCKISKTFID